MSEAGDVHTNAYPSWVPDALFYQVFPDRLRRGAEHTPIGMQRLENWESSPTPHGTKGGDLYGVIDDLDRIKSLGCNALYLNPIFSSESNHGYHTHNYFEVDPVLGGNQAFDLLLTESHKRDMRVVLDGVFNHTSRSFYAFAHVLENGLDSPFVDWFFINRQFLEERGTLLAYPDRRKIEANRVNAFEAYGFEAWWNLPMLPKLNTDNPEVRDYIYAVGRHWVSKGIDGWRLDVPTEIETEGFWEGFRAAVKKENPDCYIVGEIWHAAPEFLQGTRFDGLMNYPFGKTIMAAAFSEFRVELAQGTGYREFPKIESTEQVRHELERTIDSFGQMGPRPQMNFFTSHDTPRLFSLCSEREDELLIAWAMMIVMPGAPCLYYGDEYLMAGERDPNCRAALTDVLRESGKKEGAFFSKLSDLFRLRAELPALRSSTLHFMDVDDEVLAMKRSEASGGGSVCFVYWNRSDEGKVVNLDHSGLEQCCQVQDGKIAAIRLQDSCCVLAPRSICILY